MSHHKRGRRKNARAGCLMCKPHKANGIKGMKSAQPIAELKAREAEALEDDVAPITGIVCRVWLFCHQPELCQSKCFDRDLVEGD